MRYPILLLGFLPFLIQAQTKSPMAIGLQLDNDSFTSTYNDFYYTNGIFLSCSYLSKASTAEQTVVHGFKLGQQIYNPRWIKFDLPEKQNRPYAGYLFAEYNSTKLNSSNRITGSAFQLGIVGPGSGAEGFQKWMHRTFGFGKLYGWEYQIQNTPAVQYNRWYSKPILSKITSDKIDFHSYAKAELGTAFDGITVGVLSRISLSKSLTALRESNFYNDVSSAKREFYFFAVPKINLQGYDATIQGGLFDTKSLVTYHLNPLRFKVEAGLKYKYNQFNFGYSFHYTTSEIKNSSASDSFYGTLTGSYVF